MIFAIILETLKKQNSATIQHILYIILLIHYKA